MTDEATVRVSGRTRYRAIGKILVVVVTSVALAQSINADDRRDLQRAESLTLEQYTSEYEQHKAALRADILPPALNLVGALLLFAIAFGVYEGVGFGVGWLVERVVAGKARARPGIPSALSAPHDPD